MDNPSKKVAKSEAEIAAEAKKKKDILDKVAQSNLPTKTILKELGISRSTYYSWLKRYEDEGDEGLMDSRSVVKPEAEEETTAAKVEEAAPEPSDEVQDEAAARPSPPEALGEPVSKEEPEPPRPEQAVVEATKPAVQRADDERETEEQFAAAEEKMDFGGGQQKKGMAAYAFVAAALLVIGLLVSISLSNYNTYHLRNSDNTLTLWKGKFSPRGTEIVESFNPLVVGDGDYSALTSRTYTGEDAVYKALFAFYMDQVDMEEAKGAETDVAKLNSLLDRADSALGSNEGGGSNLANLRFQVAQKRVAIAETALHRAYEKALPIYQEALNAGLGDGPILEAKVEAMEEALGLAPEEGPGITTEETETVATSETPTEEAVTAAAPEAPAEEVEAATPSETPAEEVEAAAPSEAPAEEAEAAAPSEAPAEGAEVAATPEASEGGAAPLQPE
ncbi:MAG: helix-turn-helix domain-containing protein [Deltaproteobacteria bacterium]|nr:MAG: helix-turn-helix domain-containing protein [Deltaproteobacteria bacterium]